MPERRDVGLAGRGYSGQTRPAWSGERLAHRTTRPELVQGAKALGLPVVWLEQNPEETRRHRARVAAAEQGIRADQVQLRCTGKPAVAGTLARTGAATGWCAASRPISASTRACWDCWRAAPGILLVVDAVSSRSTANRDLAIGHAGGRGRPLLRGDVPL